MQDRGVEVRLATDRAGPGDKTLRARRTPTRRVQRGRLLRRLDLELELCAVGLEESLDLQRHSTREDQRAQAEAARLERAVEGASSRTPGSVRHHVEGHVADGRVVESRAGAHGSTGPLAR
jgi:hypothetical protein